MDQSIGNLNKIKKINHKVKIRDDVKIIWNQDYIDRSACLLNTGVKNVSKLIY